MSKLEKLVEDLSALTVLEAAELSKLLEEKWGVSAAAPVAVAVAAPGGAAPAEAAEEQTAFTVVLTAGGDIQPKLSAVPKCLMLLIGMAIPTYVINLLLGTNFMFLMYAEPGNPLYWFETTFGAHEIGFPVLIAAVIVVMHAPQILRMLKKTSA